MSAMGRPEREHRSAQHEGILASAMGRPEREHRSAQREGTSASAMGRREREGTPVRAERSAPAALTDALRRHWPEYLIEAACLGVFMVSAALCVALLEHPGSPVRQAIDSAGLRRLAIGLAMGATAVGLVYSPWGKRSGAHFNPAVTLTFLRLGRIEPEDAVWYVLAQFAGTVAGMLVAIALLGAATIADPSVDYVITRPGPAGVAVAFAAETVISFGLMLAVLLVSNRRAINRHTGLVAGALVAVYIAAEAPLSGMSMNPARSFGSAWSAEYWHALWIYFAAPLAGMLLAAEVYLRTHGHEAVLCCKVHHDNDQRCIFRCRYGRPAGLGVADANADAERRNAA